MQAGQLLEAVRWVDDPQAATPLSEEGVRYGFAGLGTRAPSPLLTARQVHGTTIIAGDLRGGNVAADGLYLHTSPGTIAVRTADCLPVLLAAPRHRLVMALHAGWRGLSAGLLQAGVERCRQLGAAPTDLYAVLGPCISLEHFEVGPEVRTAFMTTALGLSPAQVALCIRAGRGDRWHVDLGRAAVFALTQRGVPSHHIAAVRSCTVAYPCLWPSFRRDGKTDPAIWSWISQV